MLTFYVIFLISGYTKDDGGPRADLKWPTISGVPTKIHRWTDICLPGVHKYFTAVGYWNNMGDKVGCLVNKFDKLSNISSLNEMCDSSLR